MPFFEPKIVGRERCFDAFSKMSLCWAYLGHSRMTCALVSGVASSHGQVWGSGEFGRKVTFICSTLAPTTNGFSIPENFQTPTGGNVDGRADQKHVL